jgi:hypothetical protein
MAKEDRHCIDVVTRSTPAGLRSTKVALCLLDGHVRHCLVGGHGGPSDPNEQAEELMGAIGRDDPAQAETGTFSKGTGLTTPSSIRVKGQARQKRRLAATLR